MVRLRMGRREVVRVIVVHAEPVPSLIGKTIRRILVVVRRARPACWMVKHVAGGAQAGREVPGLLAGGSQ
jgi:hypothetical protein